MPFDLPGRNVISLYADCSQIRFCFQNEGIILSSAGTRLRAPECLLTNLQEEDEIEEVAQQGFQFPSQTSVKLQQAIEATMVQGVATYTDAEEIIDYWDFTARSKGSRESISFMIQFFSSLIFSFLRNHLNIWILSSRS